ncbi:MAG: amidohydrolase family protein [Actinomycetia bacterium]|nr:amidohydrolase family protein [Actinomycetes bacterium]
MSESFAFVDAHVHLWDHSIAGLRWRYLEADFDHPRLRGMHRLDAPAFTEIELSAQAGPYTPDKIVFVQSCEEDVPGLESAWVQSLADSRDAVHAIIARARVAEPGLAAVLAANSGHRLYRGVRDMASPLTIGTPEFTAGFHTIADSGASLEMLVPYAKYDDVCALADARPEMQIVLGHAGLAEHSDDDYYQAWSQRLQVFATRSNVTVKISALASGRDPDWSVASIKPWIRHCVDVFGPERAMFGTNWPIDRLFGTYERLIDAYRECTDDLTAQERDALFVGTATKIYQIK